MKFKALLFVPMFLSAGASAEAPIFAKRLVTETIRENPDMLDVIFHVTPPNSKDNVAVAAHTKKEEGEKSGADDLGVAVTGAPLVEVQKDGVRVEVLLQLRDKGGRSVGALGLMYPYKPGDDPEKAFLRSQKIRDKMAAKISNLAALFKRE